MLPFETLRVIFFSKVSDVDVLAQVNHPEPIELFFPHFSPPCHGVLCCRPGAGGCTDCRCGGSRDGRLGEGSGGQRGCCTWPITVPGERKVTSKLKCEENMKKKHQKSNTSDLQQKILYAFRNLENPQCKTSELESYHEDFDNQKSPRQKIAKAQVQQVQDSRPRGAQGVGSALKCRGDLPQWM